MKKYLRYLRSLQQSKEQRGFTLAEFFVAITIFSFISLALFYSLNVSLKVYKQQSKLDASITGAHLVAGILEREVQQAVYMNDMQLIGSATSIYFYAPRIFSDSDYPVNKVTYSVITDENENVLIKRSIENAFGEEGEELDRKSIDYFYYPEGNVESISFQYLSFQKEEGEEEFSPTWMSSWTEGHLPDSIRIDFSSEEESQTDFSYTILMPGIWSSRMKEEE